MNVITFRMQARLDLAGLAGALPGVGRTLEAGYHLENALSLPAAYPSA